MRYLMGLILSLALGTATFAQEDVKKENGDEATSSAKFRDQQNNVPDEAGLQDQATDLNKEGKSEIRYGKEEDEGFTRMERVDESGSVYYFDEPELREDLKGASNTEQAAADPDTAAESSEGSVFTLAKECSLNNMLDDRQGDFKIKREMDDAELKVKREKDGEASIKYESENEYYTYEEEEDGANDYSHGIIRDNEVIEIVKNKDGSADVFYQGHFNSVEEARALENGLNFSTSESVCNQ